MTNSPSGARFGLSGRLAAAFQANPLTPVLAILGLLLGLVAVMITPREEELQIDVTMANVFVPFAGASARDRRRLARSRRARRNRARPGNRDQANSRHSRRVHHRCARPRGGSHARCFPTRRLQLDRGRPGASLAGWQCRTPTGRARRRRWRGAGDGRQLSRRRRCRGRTRHRTEGLQAGLVVGCRRCALWRRYGHAICLAWRARGPCRSDRRACPCGDHRRGQEARQQCGRHHRSGRPSNR